MTALLGRLDLHGEAGTEALARRIAAQLRAGDVICLSGDLGAGKSVLARAVIRTLAGPDLEVPSPTFTLVQAYEAPAFEIWHADLFRLADAGEVDELGLDDAFGTAATLIEWPERAGDRLPARRLEIHLEFCHKDTDRRATLRGDASWRERAGAIVAGHAVERDRP